MLLVHATTIISGSRIALVDCTTFIARLLVVGRPQLQPVTHKRANVAPFITTYPRLVTLHGIKVPKPLHANNTETYLCSW